MQRNFEIIRQILLQLEDRDTLDLKATGDFSEAEVAYNLDLAIQAGLVSGVRVLTDINGAPIVVGVERTNYTTLTWEGHDFLDQVRDDELWAKAQREAKKKGLDLIALPIEMLRAFTMSLLRTRLDF